MAKVRDEVAEVGAGGIDDWRPVTIGIDDDGGGAPVRLQWWTALGKPIPGGKRSAETWGGTVEVEGEVERLWA